MGFGKRINMVVTRRCQSLALVFLAVALIAASFVVLPRERTAEAAAASSVQLGYFYIPPKDGTSASTLADKAGFITLTQGNEEYRDELRASGYGGAVLQYIVAGEVEGPGPYANSSAACDTRFDPLNNQVTDQVGDFCKYIHPNESWFLHNGAGKRLYSASGDGVYYRMNPASSGWRQFALARMKADLGSLGYDGIFLDNVELSWHKSRSQLTNSDGKIREFSSDSAFRNAWIGYLSQLSGGLRSSGKLWANMINDPNDGTNWSPYLQHLDGGMFESWALGYRGLSPERWNNNLRQAEAALAAGKGVLAVSPGAKTDTVKQTFALASYLLVTDNANAFFRYASNTNEHEYASFWLYPNYNVELGNPVGPRYQTGDQWRRDFECGSVTVDPAARTGSIDQTACGGGDGSDDSEDPSTPTPQPTSSVKVALDGLPVNDSVAGEISVRARVKTTDRASTKVRFYLDGSWLWTEGIAPFYLGGDSDGTPAGFDTRGWKNGNHTLSVVVTNPDGTQATASAEIVVKN